MYMSVIMFHIISFSGCFPTLTLHFLYKITSQFHSSSLPVRRAIPCHKSSCHCSKSVYFLLSRAFTLVQFQFLRCFKSYMQLSTLDSYLSLTYASTVFTVPTLSHFLFAPSYFFLKFLVGLIQGLAYFTSYFIYLR